MGRLSAPYKRHEEMTLPKSTFAQRQWNRALVASISSLAEAKYLRDVVAAETGDQMTLDFCVGRRLSGRSRWKGRKRRQPRRRCHEYLSVTGGESARLNFTENSGKLEQFRGWVDSGSNIDITEQLRRNLPALVRCRAPQQHADNYISNIYE